MASIKTILAHKKNSFAKVYLQVIINRQKRRYSLKQEVKIDDWNAAIGRLKNNTGNSNFVNTYISQQEALAQKIIYEIRLSGIEITFDMFYKKFNPDSEKPKKALTFNDFFLEELNRKKTTIHKNSLKSYYSSYYKLNAFNSNVLFKEINYSFLIDFNLFLKANCNLGTNTIHKYLSTLRNVLNQAKNRELIISNPFDKFKMNTAPSTRKFLTKDKLQLLKEKDKFTFIENKYIDLFLFQCCTGLRYDDLNKLEWKNIDGNFITIVQGKTSRSVSIPIIDEAKEVLLKQNKKTKKVFAAVSNQKYNKHLNRIGQKCGIEHLTSHVARHTFATLGLDFGIPIEVISSILGHTSIKTTQIYGKILNETKLKAMQGFKLGL